MFSHTTHHIQKRDLLWGCYTRVSTMKNPLWTKKITIKTQAPIDLFLMIGVFYKTFTPPITELKLILGCLYPHIRPIDRFIIEPKRKELGIQQRSLKYMSRCYYKEKNNAFYIQNTITEYKANFITAIPLLIFFILYDDLRSMFYEAPRQFFLNAKKFIQKRIKLRK